MKTYILLILVVASQFLNAQSKDTISSKKFDVEKERSKVKYNLIPLPSYDPSTKFGLSLINMFNYYPNKNDTISPASSGGIGGQYTTNKSWSIGGGNTLYLNEDRWRLTGQAIYGRINQELELGYNDVTDAKRIISVINLQGLRKIYGHLYFGLGYSYRKIKYEGRNEESKLQLEEKGLLVSEGNHGIRYILTYDKRDNVNYPYKGFYVGLRSEQYLENKVATAYMAHYLDFRHFINVGTILGQQVVAYRVLGRFLTGDPQNQNFSYYGRTGGDLERGYETGKYIDKNMVNVEAEYRIKTSLLKSKLWFAGLLGLGKVYGEYETFNKADWLPMVGVGARYNLLPYERMNIRFDVTYGNEGMVFYFGIREVF